MAEKGQDSAVNVTLVTVKVTLLSKPEIESSRQAMRWNSLKWGHPRKIADRQRI